MSLHGDHMARMDQLVLLKGQVQGIVLLTGTDTAVDRPPMCGDVLIPKGQRPLTHDGNLPHTNGGGLAGPVGSHQAEKFARRYRRWGVADNRDTVADFNQVAGFDPDD